MLSVLLLSTASALAANVTTSPEYHPYMTVAMPGGEPQTLRQNMVCCCDHKPALEPVQPLQAVQVVQPVRQVPVQQPVQYVEAVDNTGINCLEDCVPQCAKNFVNKLFGNGQNEYYYEEVPYEQPIYEYQVEQPVVHEAPVRYQYVEQPKHCDVCGCCPCNCFGGNRVQERVRNPVVVPNFVQTFAPIAPAPGRHLRVEQERPILNDFVMQATPEVVVESETFVNTATATSVSYDVRPTTITNIRTEYNTVGAHTYFPLTTQTIVEAKAYLRYPGATIAAEIRPTN